MCTSRVRVCMIKNVFSSITQLVPDRQDLKMVTVTKFESNPGQAPSCHGLRLSLPNMGDFIGGKPGPGAAHPADDPSLNKTQAKHYKKRQTLLALMWRGRYNKTRSKCFHEKIFPSDKGLHLANIWKNAAASLICVDCVRRSLDWFVQFVPLRPDEVQKRPASIIQAHQGGSLFLLCH